MNRISKNQSLTRDQNRFARIEGDLAVVKWMIGFNLAITIAVLWKVFSA